MATAFTPFRKYEAPPAGPSFVIFRRAISRLDRVPGEDESPYAFGSLGASSAGESDYDTLDTFEPIIPDPREVERPRSVAGQRMREAAAIMGLIAVAFIGAGLWSRSESMAAQEPPRAEALVDDSDQVAVVLGDVQDDEEDAVEADASAPTTPAVATTESAVERERVERLNADPKPSTPALRHKAHSPRGRVHP